MFYRQTDLFQKEGPSDENVYSLYTYLHVICDDMPFSIWKQS